MNDPRSSNGRGGAAKQATTDVSDLGQERGEWKDLGEVSRGLQSISIIHEGHERHEENHVFFIHEGHERHEENHVSSSTKDTKRHEEKILRKMVVSRLPLPNGAMVQK